MLTVGSLFAGIGGFDLGLERAGMRVVWQCDSDPLCRAVLAKHWPNVPRYADVSGLWGADVERPVVLAGGFPCQDISSAGKKVGIGGSRSGLWGEYARLIGELRPRYVVVENVADLLVRGLGRVLGDLATLGYDAEWDCIRAADLGAPHLRNRLWLVAYPSSPEQGDAEREGLASPRWRASELGERTCAHRPHSDWWDVEPDVDRVADGVSDQLDRLGALGNALIPQIAEWIGRRIMAYEYEQAETIS